MTSELCHRKTLLAMSVAVIAIGCGPQGGTVVGNGKTVGLDMSGYEKPATSSQALTLASGVHIENLWVAIDRVRLVPGTDCDEVADDGVFDLDGPFVAELTGGGMIGGTPTFDTDAASFCRFRVGYHRLDADTAPTGAPSQMIDQSIRVEGSLADGTPFTIASRHNDRFELEAENGSFELPAGENLLFLAYDIGSWVAAAQLTTIGTDPIVIDDDNNSDQLDAFESAVETTARLFRDVDENGQLGPGERNDALAE